MYSDRCLFSGDVPNACKYIRNRSECKDIDWATYTCVLGYHVFGQYNGRVCVFVCICVCVCVLGCLFWRCLYFPDCWIRTTFLTLKFCLPISGVWPEGSDGTDINALIRSHNRKVIALADDFCKVHLFAYPCSTFKVTHIKTHIWKC